MNILVDIDGTLTNFSRIIKLLWSKFTGLDRVYMDATRYAMTEKFNCSQEMVDRFWEEYSEKFVDMPPRLESSYTMSRLIKEGHKINIVTARGANDEIRINTDEYRLRTLANLKKYNIPFHTFNFDVQDKAKFAVDNNIDLAIEDAPFQYHKLIKVCPTFVVAEDYNITVPSEHRLENLAMIVPRVKEMENGIHSNTSWSSKLVKK